MGKSGTNRARSDSRSRKLLTTLLALLLAVGMLPLTALASIQPAFADDTGSVTITVAAVDNNTNKFIFTPTEISVPSGKAAEYGYSNAAPGTMVGGVDHGLPADAVSPLDALIAAHEVQYGVGFTPSSYLGGTSSNLTKMFGLSSYGITYSVDGLPPVGTFSDGYGINEWALEDGDLVIFTNASNENWGIDSASFFVEQSITTTVDQPFTLTLIGYDPMEVLMQNPGNPTVPITLNPVVGASIMLVDPSTGNLSSAGATTNNLGHASLVFNTPGIYHISAIGETMNYIWGEEVTCGLAYCKVRVIEAGSVEQPLLSGLTVSNLNAEGLSFDPATFTYNVTTAATSTASVALTASFDEASYYLTADNPATGLISLTSGGAGVFSTNAGINTVTLRLTDKQDIYNYSEYTVSILRPRVATLSALTIDTVNQPAINGRESGTLWKAGSSTSELGTRGFAAATKDYRAFYLSEITSTGISKATPSMASSWLRISVNGSVVFTGQDFGNYPITLDSNTTSVKIEVCTDVTFQEAGGFIVEDTYRVSIELIPLTSQEIEDIKLQSLEVTGGELLAFFTPDSAGSTMFIKAEEGATVTYKATAAAGTTVYKHITSTTAGNTLSEVDGYYTLTAQASQPYLPEMLVGYQTVLSSARDVMLGGLTLPIRYQYKFIYNTAGKMDGGPDAVVDYIVPSSQYSNVGYGLMPDKLLAGGLISLGNFGGYVTVKFDTPILNNPNNLYGIDLKINGNSNGGQGFSEPGNVWVSKDGVNFYLLAGSDYYDDNTIRDYQVTYTRNADGTANYFDNYGSQIVRNPATGMYRYPNAASYPLFNWQPGQETQITFAGPLLTSNAADPYGSVSAAFPDWGYVDVRDGDITRTPVNPYVGPTGTGNGSSYDISWAIDAYGNPVYLDEISYVRVSTASHIYAGAIGEKSTEVSMIVSVVPGAAAVGKTPAASAITVNGKPLDLSALTLTYKPAEDGSLNITVSANAVANVYINNKFGTARSYTSAPISGVVRVIVQQGNMEPQIYYLTEETLPPGPVEPALVDGYFMLNNGEDLLWFANQVNNNQPGLNAKLINNIELDANQQWAPICASASQAFQGIFDGQGHSISGLSIIIANGSGSSADSYKGLFGYIGSSGVVRNLGILDSIVSNSNSTAVNAAYLGLVAGKNDGTISNVTVDSSQVIGKQNIGGIAGQNTGSIVASANIGATVSQTTINDNGIAGIAGLNSGLVQYCYNKAAITSQHNSDYDGYFAGIVGNNASGGRVDSCYNTAVIIRGYRSAGIVAVNSGTVSNCYNNGNINANGRSSVSYGGGIVAYASSGSITNCYYLEGSVGGLVASNSTTLPEAELKAAAALLGAAFVDDLATPLNGSYPILKWQDPSTTYSITIKVSTPYCLVGLQTSDGTSVMPDFYDEEGTTFVYSGLTADTYSYVVFNDDDDYLPEFGELSLSYSDITINVSLVQRLYTVDFLVIPAEAKVTLTSYETEDILTKATVDGATSFNLPKGDYSVYVEKFGYLPVSVYLEVVQGSGAEPVVIDLASAPSHQLAFDVTPSNAVVSLSHVSDGIQTPIAANTYQVFEGNTYTYTVRAPGYLTVKESVFIGDTDLLAYITLTPGSSVWDGSVASAFAGGSGTISDPYQIADGEELAYLSTLISNPITNPFYYQAYYQLVNDIELNSAIAFAPIGSANTDGYRFSGHFDGNGFNITNLYVNKAGTAGLFGMVRSGDLHDITLIDPVVVSSGLYAGALVGWAVGLDGIKTSITNCAVVGGKVSNTSNYVGGLAGTASTVDINCCYVIADINGAYAGLLTGGAAATGGLTFEVNHSFVRGSVTTTSSAGNTGGLIGQMSSGTLNISYCYVDATVRGSTAYGPVIGGANAASSVTNSFYNSQASVSGTGSAAAAAQKLTPLSAADLKSVSTLNLLNANEEKYALLNLESEFANDGFPYLIGLYVQVVRPERLEAPSSVSWAASQALASWSAVSNAVGYSISLYKVGFSEPVSTVTTNASTLSYDFTDLVAINGSGAYVFRVKALGDGYHYYASADSWKSLPYSVQINSQMVTFDVSLPAGLTDYYQLGDPVIKVMVGMVPVYFSNGVAQALPEGNNYSYTVEAFRLKTVCGVFSLTGSNATISVQLEEDKGWDGITTIEPASIDSVYQISSGYELAWFASAVNSQLVFASGSSARSSNLRAVLLNDIDLAGHEWAPIGTYGVYQYSVVCGYTGSFDGNGHTVSGLHVSNLGTSGGAGLFGTLFTGALVKDLTVEGSISSGQYYGGIAAYTTAATISGCTSNVDITVAFRSSGRSFAGGITGYMSDPSYSNTRTLVEYCVNNCYINGQNDESSFVGGIVGSANYGLALRYCANYGEVIGCERVGGIVGDGGMPITSCLNSGAITSYATDAAVGGIVGFSNKLISDCYNTGTIYSSSGMVGGIVGDLHSLYGGMIANCYNVGSVTASGTGTNTAGAIAGYKGDAGSTTGAVVSNCYYLEGFADAGIGFNAHVDDVALPRSASDMQSLAFVNMLGAAFKAAPAGNNSGYPLLAWQEAPTGPVTGAPGSGDLNGDGYVDMSEALIVAQAVVGGGMSFTPEQFAAVDMDGDGILTMADVVLIMRRAAGL